ncbi:MAG: glycoside hydrolase family 2 TIM barrel-domain containing protein [Ignavibacteriaceae bacterium]
MKKIVLLNFLLLIILGHLHAQDKLIVNSYNRASHSLNGYWHYIVDPYENGFYNYRYKAFDDSNSPSRSAYFMNAKPRNKSDLVEYNFDASDTIKVPGDWNSQKEKLFYYEGTIWYKKSFDFKKSKVNSRVFVYFGAVNYQADVYLNGKKLGRHTGGFTPFNFEVTQLLKTKDNFLIVRVDNKRKKEAVPTLNTDWWNYGGITRDVKLIEMPENFIHDYTIQLDLQDNHKLEGFIELNGPDISNKKIYLSIPEMGLKYEITTNDKGRAYINKKVEYITYWSLDEPKIYKVRISTKEDEIQDQIGFRTIKTNGSFILLNERKIFLKGISIHEENPLRGCRAWSLEDARLLLTWAKELGCNYVRLAHYPHNEHMARLADQMGILIWEEIPVYWTIDWNNQNTYRNAENQLTEMINRDKNRASVIIWSIANETPVIETRNAFLKNLILVARKLDKTRLISAALEQSNYQGNPLIRTIKDPIAEYVDVLSFNEYIGWYDGLPDKCAKITWQIDSDKPVLISEFGGGAKYGFHADKLTRWSEEYQEYIYLETLSMINKIEQLQGVSPWILADFRSPRRPLPGVQDGWNRKGLISESGKKKKAFFVLKEYYSKK